MRNHRNIIGKSLVKHRKSVGNNRKAKEVMRRTKHGKPKNSYLQANCNIVGNHKKLIGKFIVKHKTMVGTGT